MNRQDEIRTLAYEFYEKSGMMPGRDLEHWLKAEKIVSARYETVGKSAAQPAARAMKKPPAKTAAPEGGVKAERKKTGARKSAARKTSS